MSVQDGPEYAIENSGREFQEEKCTATLRMFTKINSLRKGINFRLFDEIGFILVSGSYISNYLAFHPDVRENAVNIPYATNLEFITNRLWFKLHKKLAKGSSYPQSLSVLAKAQVVLASQIQHSVSEKFDKITKDFSTGKITEEEAKILFNELRAHVASPEAITNSTVDSALAFLDHRDYENHLRERSYLEKRAAEGDAAVAELNAIRAAQEARRIRLATVTSMIIHLIAGVVLLSFMIGCCSVIYWLLMKMGSGGSTQLSVFGIVATLVVGVLTLMRYRSVWSWAKGSHTRLVKRLVDVRA